MASALLTHTWTQSIKNDTGSAVASGSLVVSGDTEFNQKIKLAYNETAEVDCGTLGYAKMVSLFMTSDSPVTVHTNAADGSGGQTIALNPNAAWAWNNTVPGACPITANITKIFVTYNDSNATAAQQAKGATFRCGFLMSELA
jgi:hypothetical protein